MTIANESIKWRRKICNVKKGFEILVNTVQERHLKEHNFWVKTCRSEGSSYEDT